MAFTSYTEVKVFYYDTTMVRDVRCCNGSHYSYSTNSITIYRRMDKPKEEIREKVRKILNEYEGEDYSQLLMIIKEEIENGKRNT